MPERSASRLDAEWYHICSRPAGQGPSPAGDLDAGYAGERLKVVHDDGAVPSGDDPAAAPAGKGPVDGLPA